MEGPLMNKMPLPDKSFIGRTRDRLAWAITTFALTYIATPWYSAMISGLIRYGGDAVVRDSKKRGE